jgi:hypothetical protein
MPPPGYRITLLNDAARCGRPRSGSGRERITRPDSGTDNSTPDNSPGSGKYVARFPVRHARLNPLPNRRSLSHTASRLDSPVGSGIAGRICRHQCSRYSVRPCRRPDLDRQRGRTARVYARGRRTYRG